MNQGTTRILSRPGLYSLVNSVGYSSFRLGWSRGEPRFGGDAATPSRTSWSTVLCENACS